MKFFSPSQGFPSGGGSSSPLTTKGDIWGYVATNARIPVGSNGQILTADSGQASGVKWATGSGTVDATAWHKTGDTFGAPATIGNDDDVLFKAGGTTLIQLDSTDFNILMGNVPDLISGIGPRLQYRRDDGWASIWIQCDEDGSQGYGHGEAMVSMINDIGASVAFNAIGSAYAGADFGGAMPFANQIRMAVGGGAANVALGSIDSDACPVWVVADRDLYPMAKFYRYGGSRESTALAVFGGPSGSGRLELYDYNNHTDPCTVEASADGDLFITPRLAAGKYVSIRTGSGPTERLRIDDNGIDVIAPIRSQSWSQSKTINDSVYFHVDNGSSGSQASAFMYAASNVANVSLSAVSSGFTTDHGRNANDTMLFAAGCASLKFITISGANAPILMMPGESEMFKVTHDSKMSFFGVGAVVRPTVSGVSADPLAGSIATALAALGLVIDGR